ncbi:MAG: hypothetical protein CUN55_19465, partial [Phototrophicales bacterium]
MSDENFYKQVMDEIKNKEIDDALRAKAIALSEGDKKKMRNLYIALRVEKLKEEAKREVLNKVADEVIEKGAATLGYGLAIVWIGGVVVCYGFAAYLIIGWGIRLIDRFPDPKEVFNFLFAAGIAYLSIM